MRGYGELDLRLACQPTANMEIAIVGGISCTIAIPSSVLSPTGRKWSAASTRGSPGAIEARTAHPRHFAALHASPVQGRVLEPSRSPKPGGSRLLDLTKSCER